MQLADVLSVIAVLVAAASLAITLWNVRRTMEREDGRDRADLVLRYSEDSGLIDVDNEGPNTALQVSFLATGPKLSLDLQSLGTIPAGETRQYRITSPQEFLIYLSWRDGRARLHRKKYRLVPGRAGFQGDGWPEMMRIVVRPGLPRQKALRRLDRSGKWTMYEPDLWTERSPK